MRLFGSDWKKTMRIGPARWRMVDLNTAGVPSGGKYGNVRWFAKKAARHGLKVGWCQIPKCFGIYTEDGPGRFTFQLQWRNQATGEAKPLTSELLWLLIYIWDHHCRSTEKTIQQAYTDMARRAKEQEAKERYEIASATAGDVAKETAYMTGQATRPLISIPKLVGVGGVR